MTHDEITALGVASQKAQEVFQIACQENTATDPIEREKQTIRFERLRTEMHAAMNRHHAALGLA